MKNPNSDQAANHFASAKRSGNDLVDRINFGKLGNQNINWNKRQRPSRNPFEEDIRSMSGATPRGYSGRMGRVPRSKKRDMLYFVRDVVRGLRMAPPEDSKERDLPFGTTHELATALANQVQFFDCDEIAEYVGLNWQNGYPDKDVPPHPDVVLPADMVGLYFKDYARAVGAEIESSSEIMFLCVPVWHGVSDEEYRGRLFNVYMISFLDTIQVMAVGQIVNHPHNKDAMFDLLAWQLINQNEEEMEASHVGLRMVSFALQTINQPRYVVAGKRDVSLVKRQSFKKATGRFTPDSWNLVSWNVDKPVKAKDYEEGTGGKQALHYRRGHFRKAEPDWPTARWSDARSRWEQYIHGYEAGHPAFGVKKSYHLPRKEIE